MLTKDDLAGVPILASLSDRIQDDVIKAAADIRLNQGEVAVHVGDGPAFYAVLAGNFEVSTLIDGIERVIGKRTAGQIFGEIPLVFGINFYGNYRATEPARLLRLTARSYYAVVAASPEFATRMGELGRERMGGMQGIAAEPHVARVCMVGERFDPACVDLRRFLQRNQITFDWYTPDDPRIAERWAGSPVTRNDLPALCLTDGTTLMRPDIKQLAGILGLHTAPRHTTYDTIIIGGGPAGLAAAVYGASEGLRTLVIEREAPGGQAETSSRIENYLGFPAGISGDELAGRALKQALRLGAEFVVSRQAAALDPHARTVTVDDGEVLSARTVILATGVSWRRLAIPGFDALIGKGIWYGASRSEADATQGQDIHLIGAGNSAGQAAMFFANHARQVTLVVRGDALEKSMSQYLVDQIRSKPNIRVALRSEIIAVQGEGSLRSVDLADRATGKTQREDSGGVFVFIGADAETDWLPPEIARDPKGYVLTGADLVKSGKWAQDRDPWLVETSLPGVFAVGDVRYSPVKRVAAAVGEGSMAIAFVHQYLLNPRR